MNVLDKLGACGLVPVVVIDNAKDAVPAARALLAGGIDVMEITFRTAAALEAISAVAKEVPEILVGAGTVLNVEQCNTAVEAGAKFIVSPGIDRALTEYCVENDITITPGCVTPSELMTAVDCGLTVVKFFPANVYGGISAMKALNGPFPELKFIPSGGVNAANLKEYISDPSVFAVGGSWICSKKDIAEHQFEKITGLCREAVKIMEERKV